MTKKEYVVYKGESFVCIGTIKECAQHMGVLPSTVRFYTRPAYQRRIANRKNARNYITVTELEED
ncbi:hypothetical protein PDQ74_16070 [Bacillus cereus group sp. Bc005]|uniref:hypothetical protein n=1 Tax=unclassified Bacillus cereus group TaxID=2750818 RepID=UPI0022E275C2|nr:MULTISPECIES: hypothetical protein [unclassified Bacillus cereus group]MDA2195661.1 hypothetical protein [Bacillus cereus group sp. Bc238]MDA2201169.1 hypothetical protein [Bacillus cereus group sp. Bc237]MDA2758631.1 hypothetical protein [Bacillus cereus group sp. Bc007]MDA2764125.1 hypothetical protein [Bacillus cereus group sp. Bc008]MDA2775255.1 hypothetical protein [Bacillus cereus group sp. Bc005]